MTADELQAFKTKLLERKAQLLAIAQSADDAAATVELDQTRQGRLSRMDALQGQAVAIAAKNRRNQEVSRIEQALQRIEKDDYGYCQRCDNEIAAQRLEFDMSALFCKRCAEELEP
ncbi:MAG TPA: TraR/DksA C4-type zinc finger protein [Gammaproteobacteria bacterium]